MGYRGRLVAITTLTTFAVLVIVASLLLIGTQRMLYRDIDKQLTRRSNQTVAIYHANNDELQTVPTAPGGAGGFTRTVSNSGKLIETRRRSPQQQPAGSGSGTTPTGGRIGGPGSQGAPGGPGGMVIPPSVRREFEHTSNIKIPVTGEARRIAGSAKGSSFQNVTASHIRFRVLTTALGKNRAVQFARPLDEADETLMNLRWLAVAGVLSGALLSLLAAFLVTRLASKPIQRLTDLASGVTESGDLTRRVPVSGPAGDDLSKLAHRFNAMMAALEISSNKQRQLIDDASHELRTPLASLRTNLEVLLRARERGIVMTDEVLVDMIAQVDELTMLTRDLMDLASSIESDAVAVPVDITDVLSDAVDRTRRTYPNIKITLTEIEHWETRGSSERLVRVAGNLLENAAKFSEGATPIEVTTTPGSIVVTDHGVGVPDDEKASIFDRFHRGANSTDVPGSGLGLAIVREVVEYHGGTVSVGDTAGGGATFTVDLPVFEG